MKRNRTESNSLTLRQRRAIAALLSSRSIEEAARAAGCAKSTLYRWFAEGEFRKALQQAAWEVFDGGIQKIKGNLGPSIEFLAQLRDDQTSPQHLRVKACSEIIRAALRVKEAEDVKGALDAFIRTFLDFYFCFEDCKISAETALREFYRSLCSGLGVNVLIEVNDDNERESASVRVMVQQETETEGENDAMP